MKLHKKALLPRGAAATVEEEEDVEEEEEGEEELQDDVEVTDPPDGSARVYRNIFDFFKQSAFTEDE